MNVALRVILALGDEVILITPCFLELLRPSYRSQDAVRRGMANQRPGIGKDHPTTRAVIINSPHSPTGIVYTQECINQLANIIAQRSEEYRRPIYIISDDVYIRVIAPGVQCHRVFKVYPSSFVCYSTSKDLSMPESGSDGLP
jgi:aspartate aminotransferase